MAESDKRGVEGARAKQTRTKGTQSIRRALQLLSLIAQGRESGMLMRDIVEQTGFTRPTCHRIASLLAEEGLVERKARTGRYAIGSHIRHLALARPMDSPWLKRVQPYLDEASRAIGDTSFLTLRSRNDTLCIARQIGNFPIQVLSLEVGERRPLGVSSAGMAILAALSDAEATEIVALNRRRLEAVGMSCEKTLKEVNEARARGYAIRTKGLVPGTMAVSVVLDAGDKASLAAFTIAAVRQRLTRRRLAQVADFVRDVKSKIESEAAVELAAMKPSLPIHTEE